MNQSARSEARTITVPDEYSTIQAAVNAASIGDTVFVRNGIYSEHLVINKTISVIGEDAETTVIDGNDTGTVIRVTADNVSVSGFTIQNGEVGLDLVGNEGDINENMFTSNGLFNTDLKTNLEVYQDSLGVIWRRHYDLINGSYTELFHLTTETPVLSVGVFGYSDVNILMLGIFYDENTDGVAQLHEFIGYASADLSASVCVFGPPLGQYIIKVLGFSVSGNPGHFDRRITTYNGGGIAVHSSSDSTISGNVVSHNYAGIFVESSSNLSVCSNNITQNIGGLISSESANSFFAQNRVLSNGPPFGTGMALRDVRNTTIIGNLFSHNSFGINLWNSSGIDVEGNQLEWHDVWAVELHDSVGINVADNNITETASLDGIRLMFSSNNYLTRNNLTNCEHSGILYWYDNFNNTATFNNLQFSGIHHYLDGHGVEVILSANNTFAKNIFANGNNQGFLVMESNNTIITGNLVISNRKGIVLRNSSGNRVYNNSIINNTEQQGYDFEGFQNTWDSGYPLGGNYWSDYTGVDKVWGPFQNETGSDGIGDTPYNIDQNSSDHYPLMSTWVFFPADINGDAVVDIYDAILLANAYNSTPGKANWNPNADINGDGIVDIFDAILLALHFGEPKELDQIALALLS